jgi:excisionase family DNA binding protein
VRESVTPKQVAKAIGVSESSLKRWCDQGLLTSVRTAGGHRRIRVAEVLRYLRKSGQPLVVPELLGLPPQTEGAGERALGKIREELIGALTRGDETAVRQIGFDLYFSRRRMSLICDEIVAPTFAEIGRMWECGDIAVYQERRACEIALRLVQELRRTIDAPTGSAPKAIGGTLTGDFYVLPTALVELVLRDNGWNAVSLGSGLPKDTLIQAADDVQPALVWLSVSHTENSESTLSDMKEIRSRLGPGRRFAVGGQNCPEVPPDLAIDQLRTMSELERLANEISPNVAS